MADTERENAATGGKDSEKAENLKGAYHSLLEYADSTI
jgi:hypothetical protein